MSKENLSDENFIKGVVSEFKKKIAAIPESLERDITDDATEALIKLIDDRDEWKQQHENLLSVRQSDLKVIAEQQATIEQQAVKILELSEAWRKQAVALREEATRIRQTVKQATGAEERCNVRAEIYDKCADSLLPP